MALLKIISGLLSITSFTLLTSVGFYNYIQPGNYKEFLRQYNQFSDFKKFVNVCATVFAFSTLAFLVLLFLTSI